MIVENLVTNPGVEAGSGTVTVRQNLFDEADKRGAMRIQNGWKF